MDETIFQLRQMEDLVEAYPEIHVIAAGKIYDWLDGRNIFKESGNRELGDASRYMQADDLIKWLNDRIRDTRK